MTKLARPRHDITTDLTRGVCRLLIDQGFAPLMEAPLPNGRRADVMAIGPRGQLWIVEVKSCIEDWTADHKWPQYEPYCDALFLAVGCEFPLALAPERLGLIVADGFGGAFVRHPAARASLAPARRRALLLAFSRLAALRLHGLDPAE